MHPWVLQLNYLDHVFSFFFAFYILHAIFTQSQWAFDKMLLQNGASQNSTLITTSVKLAKPRACCAANATRCVKKIKLNGWATNWRFNFFNSNELSCLSWSTSTFSSRITTIEVGSLAAQLHRHNGLHFTEIFFLLNEEDCLLVLCLRACIHRLLFAYFSCRTEFGDRWELHTLAP